MNNLIILGSIGIDSIKTPFGQANDILGGSAVYSSCAASFFEKSSIISIKGEDLHSKELSFLSEKGISLDGVTTKGKNFRWEGMYEYDMNEAKTLRTEVNDLAGFTPTIPEHFKTTKILFLANMDPEVQLSVIKTIKAETVVIDTMNFWIQGKKEKVIEAISHSDILIFNEWEARQLFDTPYLVKAGREALKLGLKAAIIKKGEHGSLLFTNNEIFNCPGYPLEEVVDPTGCGDSFAGAFLGYLSKTGRIRQAMVYGSVVASFTAEGFGLEKLKTITLSDIEKRYRDMVKLREF